MFKINDDLTPGVVRTFFSADDARAFLKSEGAVNGPMGWRRPLRDDEQRRVTNPVSRGSVFYTIRNERGWCVDV